MVNIRAKLLTSHASGLTSRFLRVKHTASGEGGPHQAIKTRKNTQKSDENGGF
jgi:hypothetical protein